MCYLECFPHAAGPQSGDPGHGVCRAARAVCEGLGCLRAPHAVGLLCRCPVVRSDSVLPTQFVKILPPACTCCLLETWWCHPEGWHSTQGRQRPGYRRLWCWDAKTTCDGERRVPPGRVIAGAVTALSSGFPGRSLLIRRNPLLCSRCTGALPIIIGLYTVGRMVTVPHSLRQPSV